jgi:hypothetical protein
MHSNYDAQALIASKIIKMIFKYFRDQIYLIIYLILRKLKLKHLVAYINLVMEF